MEWYKYILMGLMLSLLAGCTASIEERADSAQKQLSKVCFQKKMDFVTVSIQSDTTAEVHCMTRSPPATYRFTEAYD